MGHRSGGSEIPRLRPGGGFHQVPIDRVGLEHLGTGVRVDEVGHHHAAGALHELRPVPAALRHVVKQVGNLEARQGLANEPAIGRGLEAVQLQRLFRFPGGPIAHTEDGPPERRENRRDVGQGAGAEQRRHGPLAVLLEQVGDDIVGFVHLLAGVGIDQVGKLVLAPLDLHLFAETRSALRTGTNPDLQVEHAQGLPCLSAEGTALELEQLEGLFRSSAQRPDASTHSETREAGADGSCDVECP